MNSWPMRHQSVLQIAVFLALTKASFVHAADDERPDFYLSFQDCKALGVGPTGGEVRVTQSPKYALACWRRSRQVPCIFESGGTSKEITYAVDFDVPPLLILVQGANAGDYLSVNQSQHTATSITRILLENGIIVTKLCSGVYVTADELDALKKEEAKDRASGTIQPQPAKNTADRKSRSSHSQSAKNAP